MLTPLTAISPVDGRYRNKTEKLADYFSEQALIRYRIRVEVEYFIALCELPLPQLTGIDRSKFAALRALYLDFSDADARRVKEIESVTNHDVKAIEYIIKEKMDTLGLEAYKEFVHFGLTSQDINNTAIPLSLREAMTGVYYPVVEEVRDALASFAEQWREVPMLARTHGQPASPTSLGKEFRYSSSGSKSSCSCSTTSPFRPSSAAPRATSTPTARPTPKSTGWLSPTGS